MQERFYALNADIKNSRKMTDNKRQSAQYELEAAIRLLNALFKREIEKPVMFTAGDEVQGLFRSLSGAALYFRSLSMFVKSAVLRGGIGAGDWTTRMNSPSSAMQDGSTYYAARAAIEAAERLGRYDLVIRTDDSRRRLSFLSDNSLTVMFDHCLSIGAMRTKPQRDKAMLIELFVPIIALASPWSIMDEREYSINYLEEVFGFLHSYARAADYDASTMRTIYPLLEADTFYSIAPRFYRYIRDAAHEYEEDFLAGSMRGITYLLAEGLDLSRVTLDRQLAKAHIVQERNAAVFFCRSAERI